MPPTFAQPSPIPRGSYSNGSGGSYSAIANAIQDRYSQDADRQTRMRMGYAQLSEQQRQHDDEMRMRAAQMAQQPAMQENAADLEMQQWMMKQRFTAQDQQQLSQQENATSELQDKLDKGEISQGEFYDMLKQVAPRVNYLKFKEQHTLNQAREMQKKAIAEELDARTQMKQAALKRMSDGLEDNIRFVLDPSAHDMLGKEVDMLDPTLAQLNPALREQKIRELGESRKMGKQWLQQPDGKWQPYDETKGGKAGSASGKEAVPKEFDETKALRLGKAKADIEGLVAGDPAYKAKVEEIVAEERKKHEEANTPPEVKKKQAVQKEMETNVKHYGVIQDSDRLTPPQKQAALLATTKMNQIIEKFGPYDKLSPELKKEVDRMASTILQAKRLAAPRGE